MPRIREEILDAVLYLYHTEADARAGTDAGGSGFLTALPVPGSHDRKAWMYAVTNLHVAEQAPIVRMNKMDGTQRIFPFASSDWVPHPDRVTDLAAVNVEFQNVLDLKFRTLLPDMHFITREKIQEYKIGVGDETVLVGRFFGRDGVQRNLPSVRAGMIAQMPDPNYKIETEVGAQEAYLVETLSIAGYSGSPVMVWVPISRYRRDVPSMTRDFDALLFLGIDCGHLIDYRPVLS